MLGVGVCRFWQLFLSPYFGERCRFYPSCSQYSIEALQEHGLVRGSMLSFRRLMRCHPFSEGGVDLVPAGNCQRCTSKED